MNGNEKGLKTENQFGDKGKLEELNDDILKGGESKAGTAKDEGTLGKMNGSAKKK